jgi:hypothetical protein
VSCRGFNLWKGLELRPNEHEWGCRDREKGYKVIRCREIRGDEIENVVDLLTRGFDRDRVYWYRALNQLVDHQTPDGWPKYGYVLVDDDNLVGVLLTIATAVRTEGKSRVRCNVSSWYVEPAYRAYGSLFAMRALRHKDTVFFNLSPAPHTRLILEKHGFVRFADGRFVSIPILTGFEGGTLVKAFEPGILPDADLRQAEIDVLADHARYGCLSLICGREGKRSPFVFGVRRLFGIFPIAHLVYCRSLEEFVRFAGSIGRFLAWRGYVLVICNANGPVRGLVGKYIGGRPKYRKGNGQVCLSDVAYSELVMFGD